MKTYEFTIVAVITVAADDEEKATDQLDATLQEVLDQWEIVSVGV